MTAAVVFTAVQTAPVTAAADGMPAQMEYLNRGTVAVKANGGVFLSWRLLGTENYDTAFDVYRGSEKIATVTDSTNYTDTEAGTSYTVVPAGEPVSSGEAVAVWDEQYITIPLDRPEGGTSLDGEEYIYSPNDVEPADVDGDGEYELILKWEPSNSFDSGKNAKHNGNVYIDCYETDGTKLWRIDMGININAGAHFTQIAAYDFDLDGKAELAMKTAPGTKDGNGEYVSAASLIDDIKNTDNSADYRRSEKGTNDTGGRVLSGPEYYTVFQGGTGAALDTVYYPHPRGTVTEWGDNWGNRSERYLTAVAYLDGVNPSVVAWRGYYAKTTATAYNLADKRLVQVADFDTSKDGYSRYAGNGNHNLTVGDVDADGRDEIICGSLALDNDFSVLWCSGRGHGDALHLADYDPTHEGMEYFSVHEDYSGSAITGSTNGNDGKEHLGGMTLYDAATGEELFHADGYGDTGRGMMANVGYSDGYFELWGAGNYASYGGTGVQSASYRPDSTNQRIFWDGNLYDELLDGTGVRNCQIKISGKDGRVSSLRNVTTINDTKNNACLTADLFGDWREEVVARGTDDASLLVYTTTIETEHKLYTLMHDRAYRMQVASQNSAYNQPPHISYYVSDENDEYDMRKTAAYVSTVRNGETAVRTENLPKSVTAYDMSVTDNKLTINNKIKQPISAIVYTAAYTESGALTKVSSQTVEITKDGYSGAIDADTGDSVFLWTEDMEPLALKLTVGMETPVPSVKPIPTATPTPTPKPTATPTLTPTATPTPDFVVEDGVLTAYNGADTDVIVPDGVTSIAYGVFTDNVNIESVILPDSVTEIEFDTFSGCKALKEVRLPSGIDAIPQSMFYGCVALTTVNIPDTVKSIGDNAFNSCESLSEIILPDGLETIDYRAFQYCIGLETIEIPEGVTEIANYTFKGCEKLRNVTLPSTLTTLGNSAFLDCTALENITLPDTVTYIDDSAFQGCVSLKAIDIENVLYIGYSVFEDCSSLTELTIGEEETEIGWNIVNDCTSLKKLTIKNMTTSIENSGIEYLEGVSVYGYIGSQAQYDANIAGVPFYDIETGEIVITEWVVNKNGVLQLYNGEATDVVVPQTVGDITITSISKNAFIESAITSITLPDSVTEISKFAFESCLSLKEVTLSASMLYLNKIFQHCNALIKVVIPPSVVLIEDKTFEDCPNVVIYCAEGSAAQKYAEENGIDYIIDETLATPVPAQTPSPFSRAINSLLP